jgi:hypothetical protein
MPKMIPIYLEERQERILRRMTKDKVSISSLIRKRVDALLDKTPAEQDPAWKIIELSKSNASDLGSKHDDYFEQEIRKESRKK